MEGEAPIVLDATTPLQPQDNQTKPTVACLRCRDQKLKCNRELPSCVRCRKQAAACRYPTPPDRKRIAQKTRQSRVSVTGGAGQDHLSEPLTSARTAKRPYSQIDAEQYHMPNSKETEAAELPSTEIGMLLLETFFKRVYNATLLFHKTIAFQLYMRDRIPGYLLRAIFAHAAVFLQQVDSPYQKYINIFPVHTLFEKSWSWARSASKEVLSLADEPTILRVQALQVLHLYYFSQCEIQRAVVHASLAYRLSQLLGYDKLYEDVASSSLNRCMQFDREMRRRCFWAAWCSFCIGSRPLEASTACERVAGLPLPAKLDKRGSVQGVEVELGRRMDVDWKMSTDSLSNGGAAGSSSYSLMAELAKLLGIWTKVQAFVSETPKCSNSQRKNHLDKLVELLDPIQLSIKLPLTDLCSRAKFYDESPELLTSVCSLYYMSRLLIHASMVPIHSIHPAEPPDAPELVRKHAQLLFLQTTEYVELLQQFLERDLDATRLWPFSGYAAFMTGSVFLVYSSVLRSSRPTGQSTQLLGPDSEEMKTIQTVLEVLSLYWKPLRRLATKLDKAIEASPSRFHESDSIISPPNPGNTRRSGHSSENHSDYMDLPNSSDPNVVLLRTSYISLLSDDQPAQDADRREDSTESYRHLPGQQLPSQTPDSGPRSALLEASSMNIHEGGLFHAGWWNTAPAATEWEDAFSLDETFSRDAMT